MFDMAGKAGRRPQMQQQQPNGWSGAIKGAYSQVQQNPKNWMNSSNSGQVNSGGRMGGVNSRPQQPNMMPDPEAQGIPPFSGHG